jgi:hypothetical protein
MEAAVRRSVKDEAAARKVEFPVRQERLAP